MMGAIPVLLFGVFRRRQLVEDAEAQAKVAEGLKRNDALFQELIALRQEGAELEKQQLELLEGGSEEPTPPSSTADDQDQERPDSPPEQ